MAINQVQFPRGLPMAEFMGRYGTQEQCHAAPVASRWPNGFVCSECGCSRHSTFLRDELRYWRCSACREQTTVTCWTAFQATTVPLTSWFLAMRYPHACYPRVTFDTKLWPPSYQPCAHLRARTTTGRGART